MNNDVNFEDAESYSFNFDKNKLTFKDIVLLHLQKISHYASVEMRGGYWENRPSQNQMNVKVYIPDTRESYSNAIQYLADILYPYYDKKMKEAWDKAEKEVKDAFNSTTVYVEPTRDYDEDDESRGYRKFSNQADKVSFRDLRMSINKVLFRELCCFLYRKKYLELGVIED